MSAHFNVMHAAAKISADRNSVNDQILQRNEGGVAGHVDAVAAVAGDFQAPNCEKSSTEYATSSTGSTNCGSPSNARCVWRSAGNPVALGSTLRPEVLRPFFRRVCPYSADFLLYQHLTAVQGTAPCQANVGEYRRRDVPGAKFDRIANFLVVPISTSAGTMNVINYNTLGGSPLFCLEVIYHA